MSESGANRGLRGLLSASCIAKCTVSFACTAKTFRNPDGSKTIFEIVDGRGKSKTVPSKKVKDDEANCDPNEPIPSNSEEEEQEEYDRKITVNDRNIEGDEDDDFAQDIVQVADFFRGNVCLLFDGQVRELHLEFGVKDEGHLIHLITGSVTTTVNGFTRNLMRKTPNGESEFTEFITRELAAPASNGTKCITGKPDCLKADYKVPRIFVILYRAHERFPDVDEARLYRVIKSRIQAIDPDISQQTANVCIACTHVYTAEQRKYQGQKLTNKLPRYVDPPTFEALVPAELSLKGKRDVGETREAHKPFCYMINVTDSPYRTSTLDPKEPPKPPSRSRTAEIRTREKWVDRLANGNTSHSIRVVNDEEHTTARGFTARNEPLPQLDPIERTRVSYSEKLAPRTYKKKPFEYAFLERMKEKANRNLRKSQMSRK